MLLLMKISSIAPAAGLLRIAATSPQKYATGHTAIADLAHFSMMPYGIFRQLLGYAYDAYTPHRVMICLHADAHDAQFTFTYRYRAARRCFRTLYG